MRLGATLLKRPTGEGVPIIYSDEKYAFLAIDNKLSQYGLKKIRRIGHTMEFEQIKEYVTGDDVRTINWKATAKAANLMVNQYQDEKSQPIYSIIDASRVMKMPFNGLTLLDYAINSTLAFSNVALKKVTKPVCSPSQILYKIIWPQAVRKHTSIPFLKYCTVLTHAFWTVIMTAYMRK